MGVFGIMNNAKNLEIATRCHDIQVSLIDKEVPEFDLLPKIGMLVRLALHFRGLPQIIYSTARLVASFYLDIPNIIFKELLFKLAEIEFVMLDTEGDTIHSILPTVPYFDQVYENIGEYANTKRFNEYELLAIKILDKLTDSPQNVSSLYNLGAEKKAVSRSIHIGDEGGYVLKTRARGKDIVYSPLFFSENSELYSDLVARSGAKSVGKILDLLKKYQGWPLSLIEKQSEICGEKLSTEEVELLVRLAQDGVVKPPTIITSHHGENNFLFTPTPGYSKLHPSRKDIFEKAMALVAAVRQGQLLPNKYRIRSPYAILRSLKDTKYLRANSEAKEQYSALLPLRIGYLKNRGNGMHEFRLHDTRENDEALNMAIQLINDGFLTGMEADDEARIAFQNDPSYIESIISSNKLRKRGKVSLSEEMQMQMDDLFLGGM